MSRQVKLSKERDDRIFRSILGYPEDAPLSDPAKKQFLASNPSKEMLYASTMKRIEEGLQARRGGVVKLQQGGTPAKATDEEIQKVGLRGLFIGNFDPWDANAHMKLVKEKYGWRENPVDFERTYRRFSNLDDMYENGIHDYLKYVKFGYGRGTDHACKDIRGGYMTRSEGVEMVKKYDHVKSSDLQHWLDYVGKDEIWFDNIADSFRSPKVWVKDDRGTWHKKNLWD